VHLDAGGFANAKMMSKRSQGSVTIVLHAGVIGSSGTALW